MSLADVTEPTATDSATAPSRQSVGSSGQASTGWQPAPRDDWLQRNIPMLLRRVAIPLTPEHPKRFDQSRATVPGIDDVVDVPSRRGRVRVSELLGVLLDQPVGHRGWILGPCYLFFK